MVLKWGKGNIIPDLCIILPSSLQKFDFSRGFAALRVGSAKVVLKMECGDFLCAKRAHVLSRNEIREIVM